MTAITLTQYGRMAEKHWREFLPNLVQEMEAKGILEEMLLEAEEKTASEMHDLTMQFQKTRLDGATGAQPRLGNGAGRNTFS